MHFRRNKPKTRTYNTPEFRHDPSWWVTVFDNRPLRRETKALEIAALKDADSESAIWPVGKKPHTYYW